MSGCRISGSLTNHGIWSATDAPILFFGFDNSYFYAIAHTVLLLASDKAYALPRHYVTNEFYELGHLKFSKSRNHVVWATCAFRKWKPDALRYYVSKTNPSYQRSSFDVGRVIPTISRDLVEPLRAIFE